VLNPVPKARPRGLRNCIQGRRHRSITNGVDGHRITPSGQTLRSSPQRYRIRHPQPLLRRCICIRFLKCCAARPQRAIGVELDASDAQPSRGLHTAEQKRFKLGILSKQVTGHAERQFASFVEARQGSEHRWRRAHFVHARQANLSACLQAARQIALKLLITGRRQQSLHERHRRIDEDTGWRTVGRSQKRPARGVLCAAVNTRQLQRRRVHPCGMPIDPLQIHWPRVDHLIQPRRRGKHRLRPQVLVPTATDKPFALSQGCACSPQASGHRLKARQSGQISSPRELSQPGQMHVRVHQPRQHRGTRQVDTRLMRLGLWWGQKQLRDLPMTHPHSRSARCGLVQR